MALRSFIFSSRTLRARAGSSASGAKRSETSCPTVNSGMRGRKSTGKTSARRSRISSRKTREERKDKEREAHQHSQHGLERNARFNQMVNRPAGVEQKHRKDEHVEGR